MCASLHRIGWCPFAVPSLRKLCTAVSLVGSSPPIFVVALAAALFVPLDRCQLLLF